MTPQHPAAPEGESDASGLTEAEREAGHPLSPSCSLRSCGQSMDTPTPVPSEVAETTAGEREVEAWDYALEGDWLVQVVNGHTCGTGPDGYYGAHEPGCGSIPIANIAALLDRVRREEGERIAQAIEAEGVNGMPHLFGRAAAIARAESAEAAHETCGGQVDVTLTRGEREMLESYLIALWQCDTERGYQEFAGRVIARAAQIKTAGALVAADDTGDAWRRALVKTLDRAISAEAAHEAEKAAHEEAEQHIVQLTESRDRAEAAHERLRRRFEALADEWAEDYPGPDAACNRTPDEWATDLRSLLSGGEAR